MRASHSFSQPSQPTGAIALNRAILRLRQQLHDADHKIARLRQELLQAQTTAKTMTEKFSVANRAATAWERRYRELEARRGGFEAVATVGVGDRTKAKNEDTSSC